jgi:hypothetical protein
MYMVLYVARGRVGGFVNGSQNTVGRIYISFFRNLMAETQGMEPLEG